MESKKEIQENKPSLLLPAALPTTNFVDITTGTPILSPYSYTVDADNIVELKYAFTGITLFGQLHEKQVIPNGDKPALVYLVTLAEPGLHAVLLGMLEKMKEKEEASKKDAEKKGVKDPTE